MKTPDLNRRDAVEILLQGAEEALFVTGLGSPSYDLHSFGDRDNHFYLWGAMGGAALVGLGLAQAQPERRVIVITGDGEQLMAMGGLVTIATARPRNLDLVVLDNQHYGETGMQESHTARGIDLAHIAKASGFALAESCWHAEEVKNICEQMQAPAVGPRLAVFKVSADKLPRSLPYRDAVFHKNRFRAHLGLAPN